MFLFSVKKENRINKNSLFENAINLYGYFEYTQKKTTFV